jgi:hypothetical protein
LKKRENFIFTTYKKELPNDFDPIKDEESKE